MTEHELIRLLEANAYAVSGLTYGPTQQAKKWHQYIYNPQVGDLVLEISTIGSNKHAGKRLGKLKKIEREFIPFIDEPDEGYYDTFYYLELFDGGEFKWSNCRFIRVVDSIKKVWEIDHQ